MDMSKKESDMCTGMRKYDEEEGLSPEERIRFVNLHGLMHLMR